MATILIVDDEVLIRQLARSTLERLGLDIIEAKDGLEALEVAREKNPSLMLLDVIIPELNGFEVCRALKSDDATRAIRIIMLTGERSEEDRERGFQAGADDFFFKPFSPFELMKKVQELLESSGPVETTTPVEASLPLRRSSRSQQEIDEMKTEQLLLYAKDVSRLYDLEMQKSRELQETMDELARTNKLLLEASRDSILRLSIAAEFKDPDTGYHIRRMSRYCEIVARALIDDEQLIRNILLASPMHDVGKIGIKESILLKPGKLTPEEFDEIKTHTTIGARILSGSSCELIQLAEIIALTHHEKFNGTGYPQGLAGESIPLVGRIAAIADVFDALTTQRPYKPAFELEKALDIIRSDTGTHFDPSVTEAFMNHLEDILAAKSEYQDHSSPHE